MQLMETRTINFVPVDGYYESKQAWFSREQIGSTLEYSNPWQAITNIHNRHKERFENKAVQLNLSSSDGKTYDTWVYNFKGVLEICRWSQQPKADMVMDALYDMAESVVEKGYYSLLSDEELVTLITERQKRNPETLNLIDKTKIKREILQGERDRKEALTREVWFKRFTHHEEVDVQKELRSIWAGDMPMYHKYLDKFHADENRERKGLIVTI